jgi:hypothetical protein
MQNTCKKYNLDFLSGQITESGAVSFGGLSRPSSLLVLQEPSKKDSPDNIIILERYFSDVQNLFLKKLSAFAISGVTTDSESIQLRALLEEMIKVKRLIQGQAPLTDEKA